MDEATQPKEKFNYFQRILVLLAGHVYDILDLNNIGSWNPESKSNSFSLGSYTKRRRTLKRTASQISFDRETLAIMVNKLCSFTSIQHLHINFADHYSEVFRKIAEKKPQFFRNLYLSFSG